MYLLHSNTRLMKRTIANASSSPRNSRNSLFPFFFNNITKNLSKKQVIKLTTKIDHFIGKDAASIKFRM